MAIGLVSAKMGLQGRSQYDSVLMDILFQIKKVSFTLKNSFEWARDVKCIICQIWGYFSNIT